MTDSSRERNPIGRAFELIRCMSHRSPDETWGVRDLAAQLKIAPSTAHRLLTTLAGEGIIERDAGSERYRLGMEMYRLAWQLTNRNPVKDLATPFLAEVVDKCQETTLLGLYDRTRRKMIFASSVESSQPLRYVIDLNEWVPMHTGASALAIVAFLPEAEQQAAIADIAASGGTPPDSQQLQQICADGYVRTASKHIPGAVGIAAPIFDQSSVIGDVVITVPQQRYRPQDESLYGDLARQAAAAISDELRGRA